VLNAILRVGKNEASMQSKPDGLQSLPVFLLWKIKLESHIEYKRDFFSLFAKPQLGEQIRREGVCGKFKSIMEFA